MKNEVPNVRFDYSKFQTISIRQINQLLPYIQVQYEWLDSTHVSPPLKRHELWGYGPQGEE